MHFNPTQYQTMGTFFLVMFQGWCVENSLVPIVSVKIKHPSMQFLLKKGMTSHIQVSPGVIEQCVNIDISPSCLASFAITEDHIILSASFDNEECELIFHVLDIALYVIKESKEKAPWVIFSPGHINKIDSTIGELFIPKQKVNPVKKKISKSGRDKVKFTFDLKSKEDDLDSREINPKKILH